MNTMEKYIVDNAKAIVLIIHGSGEHFGRYKHVVKWLNENGISVIGGDLPGLGKAPGIRGHIDSFDDYLYKVDEWFNAMKADFPNTPKFIFGHSLGGLIVIRYLEKMANKKELTGAILSSPAVSIGIDVPGWQLTTANFLRRLWPTFRLKSGITASQVSRDPLVVKQYASDPLVYSKVSINWFFEFQDAIASAWKEQEKLKDIDLLYLQAGADLLVNPEQASKFAEQVHSEQLTFHLIPELYHEIFNEPEKETYLKLMTNWIYLRI